MVHPAQVLAEVRHRPVRSDTALTLAGFAMILYCSPISTEYSPKSLQDTTERYAQLIHLFIHMCSKLERI